MILTKFRDNWPFSSGEEAKNRSQDGFHGCHLGFPIGTILAIFYYKSLQCFLPSFKSIGRLVQEIKRKIYFQDGRYGGQLGFPMGTI